MIDVAKKDDEKLAYDRIAGLGVLVDKHGNIGGPDYLNSSENLPLVVETFGRELTRIVAPVGGWTQVTVREALNTCSHFVDEHGVIGVTLGELGIGDTEL